MNTKLDLVLVNPGNLLSQFGGVSSYATIAQPLGITMLANFVRQRGYSVNIIDAEVEGLSPDEAVEKILQYDPLLVGFTTFTTKMTAVEKILSILKERAPHTKTVIGGHHASSLPERTLRETPADFVIRGEGYHPTISLLKILKEKSDIRGHAIDGLCYKIGDEIVVQPRAGLYNLEELPLPAWDLLPMDKYRAHHWQCWGIGQQNSFALVYSSLGCPFNCEFCSVNVVYGKRGVRYLSPEGFVKTIDVLVKNYNTKHLEIIDDTFTLNKDRVIQICDLIIQRGYNLNMWCFARTDRVDPFMLEKMKKAGINWVFLGIEAGSDNILENISKHQNITQIKSAVDAIHNAGIYVGGNYIFGLPGDNYESMQQTLNLALDLNTEWANFFVSMAYPGAKLYDEALKKNVLPEKWEQYGFFAPNSKPLPTEFLTSEEIIRFRDRAFEIYFSGEKYQKMIEKTFGPDIVQYIKNMLTKKINRIYESEKHTDRAAA